MGVVTVSSSAGQTPLGLSTRFSTLSSPTKRVSILAFKANKPKNKSLVAPQESICLPIETSKESPKRLRRNRKSSEPVRALPVTEAQAPSCTLDLDFNKAAAKLENLYKLSPPTVISDTEDKDRVAKKGRRRRKRVVEGDEKREKENIDTVVRSQKKKVNRLSLEKRIALGKSKELEAFTSAQKRKHRGDNEYEKINRLVREYSASTNLNSLDWRKMKIPPVLPSSEHAWLFKLMQPMKAIFPTKETLQNNLGREPTDSELAEATNMNVLQLRKHMQVGKAARNKLIKHNLRLILFVINKYFHEFSNSPRFQDLCQAGVKGLITAIDRFEPGRKLRLSTYGLFWIRHAIIRSITLSSFIQVSFGLESLRSEIQRAKLELLFELHRMPKKEEIIKKVGISPERYYDVMDASRPVSLNARNPVTQEEFIDGIADDEGDEKRQPALLRLALDDVLDSLKPKESLVIRQRYGLDGKGDRTLAEIASNLNISREMVRKHEVKALMKLKHPARVDYLRQYVM